MTAGGLPQHDSAATFQLYWSRTGALRWRLLAANNRELGRGRQDNDDPESATLDAKRMAYDVDRLRARFLRREDGRWDWQLLDGADVVAESCSGYDRHVRCQQALARFVAEVPHARMRARVLPDRERSLLEEGVVLPDYTRRSPGRREPVAGARQSARGATPVSARPATVTRGGSMNRGGRR